MVPRRAAHFARFLSGLALFVSACGGSGNGGSSDANGSFEVIDAGADGSVVVADGSIVDGSVGPDADVTMPDATPADAAPAQACNDCHGDDSGIAPPMDVSGNTATTARGVGAHRTHLDPEPGMHRDIQCTDCHLVPAEVDAEGHTDTALPAELTWGPVALADGASPTFDGTTATCNNVYCHGATLLPGGTNTTPVWTNVGVNEADCGTCHSLPPAAPHPASSACYTCHPNVDNTLTFLAPQSHIDGTVDLVPGTLSCMTCHGSGSSAAPPNDLAGSVDTAEIGVGAHRSHLSGSSWHAELRCDDCHLVPATVGAVGHMDTSAPAELTWSGLAIVDGASPVFDRTATTCSGVYCHGATLLPGGSNVAPNWTVVGVPGQAQAACGTCHSLPPAAPHPAGADCSNCHASIEPDFTFPDPSLHINGVVEVVSLDCTSCHGDSVTGNPAPPRDTSENTSTTARGVGAHASHLEASTWHAPVACTECHVRPADIGDVGHADSALPAELTWGLLATADGASPSFNGTSCANVYCHGATLLSGGSNTAPTWTSVGAGEADCGSCHSLPPAAPHPANSDCALCHSTIAPGNASFVYPDRHVDGVVDLENLDCTSCHGDVASDDPAPPRDTSDNSSTTLRGVGAHQSHLTSSSWRASIDCTECHVVPSSVAAAGHIDTALPAELSFGGRATADGALPSFNGGTTTCTNVYCHGATLQPGGTNTTPDWTSVGTGEASCGSCHGLPPGGTHTSLTSCEDCHGDVVDAGMNIINSTLHVDGTVQVSSYHPPGWSSPLQHGSQVNNNGYGPCQSCHGADLTGGSSLVSCDSCHSGWKTDCVFCHGGVDNLTGAPPEGIDGEDVRTQLAVGAHTEHVSTTDKHIAWNCDKCHTIPASAMSSGHIDGDGRAEVVFSALNSSASYIPSLGTCSNLYCHGNGSSTRGTMVWSTNPNLDCGSCHASFLFPSSTALSNMSGEHRKHVREGYSCSTCHAQSVNSSGQILQLDRHVDGIVDISITGFNSNGCSGRGSCGEICHEPECWD